MTHRAGRLRSPGPPPLEDKMKVEARIILTMPDGENIELSLEDARKLRDDLDQALPLDSLGIRQ